VLATVNCGLLFTDKQAVNWKVVGETERVGGTGVAVGAVPAADAADSVGELFDPVAPPGCVPAGVCEAVATVDVPLAAALLPEEEFEEEFEDALDDVNGDTTIERGLCWVSA